MTNPRNSSKRTTKTYELDCTACTFERTIDCDLDEAYDIIEAHEANDGIDDRHFVDLELIESSH